MKTDLTQEQIAQYQRDGFIVIEEFLDADELTTWRAMTDEAVAQRLEAAQERTTQRAPDSYYAQVFTQCQRLGFTHTGMGELMMDPRLGQVAATLAGVDGIRIWHDQALIKPPYGNPTGFHFDNPYWSFSSRDAISIWVALDDATQSNGCLWYLPGTHHSARFELVEIGENLGDIFKAYPEWHGLEAVHAAGANLTPYARRAMTCAYMPDGSTFNGIRNILGQEYFESLQVGDVLDNEDENPLVWHVEKLKS